MGRTLIFLISSSFGRLLVGLVWRYTVMEGSEVNSGGNRVEEDEAGRKENEDEFYNVRGREVTGVPIFSWKSPLINNNYNKHKHNFLSYITLVAVGIPREV